ncbi:unnamed protein product [Peronospora belbahrii]|uniref:Ysc84 actin-binding domain-containing protein n=1 Tax=Peronospora belbahrii TaxID=622444 RepID=A0AAU9LCW7_9STRA|nr:unnamed protein product [Peronospora belbahrii]
MSGGTTDAVPCLSSDDVAAALREQLARNGGVYALLRTGLEQVLASELNIAVGPIGRAANAATIVGRGGGAPNYLYSHSKGFYGGLGLSGGVICTRKSLNARCYGPNVTVRQILGGEVACSLALPLWKGWIRRLPYLLVRDNPHACANCGDLLIDSVSVHSGRLNTSQVKYV